MSNIKYVFAHGKRIAVETILPPSRTSRRKRQDTFVQVPLPMAAALAKATSTPKAMAWLMVLYEVWANKGKPFKLSNVKLRDFGVKRDTKLRALAELEASGMITIERQNTRSLVIHWLNRSLT